MNKNRTVVIKRRHPKTRNSKKQARWFLHVTDTQEKYGVYDTPFTALSAAKLMGFGYILTRRGNVKHFEGKYNIEFQRGIESMYGLFKIGNFLTTSRRTTWRQKM